MRSMELRPAYAIPQKPSIREMVSLDSSGSPSVAAHPLQEEKFASLVFAPLVNGRRSAIEGVAERIIRSASVVSRKVRSLDHPGASVSNPRRAPPRPKSGCSAGSIQGGADFRPIFVEAPRLRPFEPSLLVDIEIDEGRRSRFPRRLPVSTTEWTDSGPKNHQWVRAQ